MESLYRKYRPQTFADVVGQQHVVGTLERAVLDGRTSHAYLFCGPRGTGKTTMARLLAKALMCEQGAGHLPDGTCAQCELIAAGEHPDVYELDAASRTGVDSVREEIINRVSYAPTQGRYKVYIIDEVHMLTSAAFNALLKTLEEPPGHVVFVLCTTDPQKIPATILSRVQRFDFRPIGDDDILAHLAHVCEQEGFTYEDAALELVTSHARGGMRDALSTLEQLSVFGSGVIGLEAAQDLLGAVTGMALEQVINAMAKRDAAALFVQVGEMVNAGRDLLQFTRELAAHMRDVYVVSVAGPNPSVLPAGANVRQLQAEAASFGSSDRLARILTLLGDVSRQMATAPNQRLVLEIAFTRIARPDADLTLEALAERMAELENKLAGLGEAAPSIEASSPSAASTATQPSSALVAASSQAPRQPAPSTAAPVATQGGSAPWSDSASTSAADQTPVGAKAAVSVSRPSATRGGNGDPRQWEQRPSAYAPASGSAQPRGSAYAQARPVSSGSDSRPAAPPQTVSDPGALQRSWRKVVSELMVRIPSRGTLVSNAVATSDNGAELVVSLPKGSSFALKMLERPDMRAVVEGVVAEVFGHRTLVFREGAGDDPQPSMQRPKGRAAAPSVSSRQSQPAPRQAPQLDSRPTTSGPQTNPQPSASAPQPAKASYPMPWDAPIPTTSPEQAAQASYGAAPEEPYYEQVPYEDLGAFVEPEDPMYAPSYVEQTNSAPRPVPEPTSSQTAAWESGTRAATSPVSTSEPQPQTQSAPELAPEPQPASPASTPTPKPEPPDKSNEGLGVGATSATPEVPSDLPPELLTVLQNAFEVFGEGVHVTRDS